MVSGSDPTKEKIRSYIKAVGCGSDCPSTSGCVSGITSSRACCGKKFCRKVENETLPVYSDKYYDGFLIDRLNRDNLVIVSL